MREVRTQEAKGTGMAGVRPGDELLNVEALEEGVDLLFHFLLEFLDPGLVVLLFLLVIDEIVRFEVRTLVEVVHAVKHLADVGETGEDEQTDQILDSGDIGRETGHLL